jgi:predicted AAA+ superfamily ATPase
MFEKIIIEQNPHWSGELYPQGFTREQFSKLLDFLPLPHVVAVSGARRVGKSTLLKQLINHLILVEKISPKDIFFMNLENPFLVQYAQDVQFLQMIFEDYLKVANPQGLIYCFLDEIQFFNDWPIFIKALYEQKKVKFFITGSNSSLLSDDLLTLLSGRTLSLEMLPFSFKELAKEKLLIQDPAIDVVRNRPRLRGLMEEYLHYGGFPDVVLAPSKSTAFDVLGSYTKAVLYQDVAPRLQLKKPLDLERLFVYLMSTIGTPFSYHSLSKIFDLSDKTIKEYVEAFTDSFLLFPIDRFSFSLKQQIKSSKKCYAIDPGHINATAFKFSENSGRLLENIVYLELRRRNFEVYTHKTENDLEVDFIAKRENEFFLIQVAQTLSAEATRKREIQALVTALTELKLNNAMIVTIDEEEEIMVNNFSIQVIPAYKFLLIDLFFLR